MEPLRIESVSYTHLDVYKRQVQSYFPFQDRGGPVVKVRALARGLAKRGQQITVLTADLGFGNDYRSDVNIRKCEWGWQAEENGVETIYLSTVAHLSLIHI